MRMLIDHPNQALREAMLASEREPLDRELRDLAVDLVLASTLGVPHDGTLELDDGALPRGVALPLGVARNRDGSFDVLAYSDEDAAGEAGMPLGIAPLPLVPVAGDDLMLLAARNDSGVHVNPGMDEHLRVGALLARQIASRIERLRLDCEVRILDEHAMVTVRRRELELEPDERAALADALTARGAHVAWLAEYTLHDRNGRPGEFVQVIVVGDEDGSADHQLREDARIIVAYLTGRPTDSVAFDTFGRVDHVAEAILRGGVRGEPSSAASATHEAKGR